jgi:hypothetical protein
MVIFDTLVHSSSKSFQHIYIQASFRGSDVIRDCWIYTAASRLVKVAGGAYTGDDLGHLTDDGTYK